MAVPLPPPRPFRGKLFFCGFPNQTFIISQNEYTKIKIITLVKNPLMPFSSPLISQSQSQSLGSSTKITARY